MYWPILRSVRFSEETWHPLPHDAPITSFPVDFQLWRNSRPLAHIDYRLRRMDDSTVLREVRHVPRESDGRIALGHDFDMSGTAPAPADAASGNAYETFVVQAVPMDTANHPASGSCNYIEVHWVAGSTIGVEPDPGRIFFSEPMPGLPYDRICQDWDLGDMDSLLDQPPPRNIRIDEPYDRDYDAYDVVPDRLGISTSGETIRITNNDIFPHRFMSTDDSEFGLLGGLGTSDAERGERTIDTGLLATGDSTLITLPAGLPSPYWFNLVEVQGLNTSTGTAVEALTEHPRVSIIYANRECWSDY
jgi:hypothetical protein